MELSSEQKRRIRQRAKQFVERWTKKHDVTESRESQTFINEFFGIFDIDRFASNIRFEYLFPKDENNKTERADCFWPGVILIENKTPGESLGDAFLQAKGYFDRLKKNYPKCILINNFRVFRIYKIENNLICHKYKSFHLEDLPKEIDLFYYMITDCKHKSIIKEVIEKPVEIEKITKEIVCKTRYGILILASSLSLALGYIISDGQPRGYLESVIEGSTRGESTR